MHPNDVTGSGEQRRVLITGGAGRIATAFATATTDDYSLTLLDLPGAFRDEHRSLGVLVEADFSDLTELTGLFDGIDTVVHLGGERRPGAQWATLLPANVIGTYNVVSAALAASCRRLVYASSVHAVTGHDPSLQVRESDPPRPASLYGATKCWGEALGASAAAEGLSFVALRIGAAENPSALDRAGSGWMVRDFLALDDLVDLIRAVIEAEPLRYEIFNAVGAQSLARLRMDKARKELGFTPVHDAISLSPLLGEALTAANLSDKTFASGFRNDVDTLRTGAHR